MLIEAVISVTWLSMVLGQEVPVSVTRGGDGDIVSLSSSEGFCGVTNCSEDSSYLVEDRECVEDTTLQRSEEIASLYVETLSVI